MTVRVDHSFDRLDHWLLQATPTTKAGTTQSATTPLGCILNVKASGHLEGLANGTSTSYFASINT